MYITIDGGTTNTRLSLFDKNVVDTYKLDMGARLGLKDKAMLFDGVKKGIATLLERNGLNESSIKTVIASGMITSEGGLQKVDHIPAPAGKAQLKQGIVYTELSSITHIPFAFIPGVRLFGQGLDDSDVMRGEETELFGISKLMGVSGSAAYILPGSHSKLIFTDDSNRICDFFTALTGEMIAALSSGTILANEFDLTTARLNDFVYEGCRYTMENGINKALFKVRVLSSFLNGSRDDAYSFFIGAILAGEIEAVKSSAAQTVFIAGRAQIKQAEALLLQRFSDKKVISVPDEYAGIATSVGMVDIFET